MAALPSPLPEAYTDALRVGDQVQWAGRVHTVARVTTHHVHFWDGTYVRKVGSGHGR